MREPEQHSGILNREAYIEEVQKLIESFSIGLVQSASSSKQSENWATASKAIRKAASQGAQIICLQELFRSQYFCREQSADNFSLAEPIEGETVSSAQALAKELDVVLVVPFFEKRAAGLFHNSAAVIDADGTLLGVYRKMHIPDDPYFYEKFYFTPGDDFQVFETKFAKVGVLICWDQWFPEAARITALMGAEVVFYPTAIGWLESEKDLEGAKQRSAWQSVQRAHAINNGIYVAAVNRVGKEEAIEFYGSSFICDPLGQVISEASTSQDEILVAECSRTELERVRRDWPFLRDRRIDAYGQVASRLLD